MNANSKRRILFIDDEPLILEVLRITLQTMHGEWDVAYASSGEEALELMAKAQFDVVVSDMRMPGMTGAQLLTEVMKRYPATVRIILTGYAEQELIMKCVGAAHLFLSKPFELKALQATLHRVYGLKERLHSDEIQKLVARKDCLPSVPAVYLQILEALQTPDCPVQRIGEIVATDPGLTTKILQLVNSAFFGFAREVSSADEAVILLGVGTIRSLALTLHLFSAFSTGQGEESSLNQVWNHCLRVGRIAKKIAELEGADEKLTEEAFTAGLLHDVGKLILADNRSLGYLELIGQARTQQRLLTEAEQEVFRATHADVGGYLLDLWGLPAPLVEAVAFHHEPMKAHEHSFAPLTAVHVANVLEQSTSAEAPSSLNPFDLQYLTQLKLEKRLDTWREAVQKLA